MNKFCEDCHELDWPNPCNQEDHYHLCDACYQRKLEEDPRYD